MMINDNFRRSDKFILRFILIFLASISLFFLFLHFDKAVRVGYVDGTVISVAFVSDGYRSFTSTAKANIELSNGAIVYKTVPGAKKGDRITVAIYRRKITGIEVYR